MGRIRTLAGVISVSAGLLLASANPAVAAQPAPELVLNLASKQVNLSDYKGQVVYLDFWASWCKPCQRSFPWMNDMQAKYGEQGFTVVAINLDSERRLADEFLRKLPAHFPVAFDPQGNSAQTYKLKGMPTSYLIDKTGQLRIAHQGFHIEKQASYEQEIQGLLAE
ncbi:TlpA disulfide reductase family protein [uncultured Alteromonas sp.]|jgi:thiol-disulfide isomerase/thioredoxin|uniref:TlpA disulfide reductase family protein n=1 Tax=uncultured Alteromonas sp. TaxID=179113 RepID=UPI0025DAD3BE|nr:redoxin domain-containing protein [uncultured Alteromonas sp.]